MKALAVVTGLAALLLFPCTGAGAEIAAGDAVSNVFDGQDREGIHRDSDTVPVDLETKELPFRTTSSNTALPPPPHPAPDPRDIPPISQELVREGEFALRLLDVLNLGSTDNETEAISRLSDRGIMPGKGWLADFPITPATLGELSFTIGTASSRGAITMAPDEARAVFAELAESYGLSVATSSPPQTGQVVRSESDVEIVREYVEPAEVEYHYAEYGPPVVTYYSPPPRYYYMYGWVPYPFWWGGYYFGGYYILHDFHVAHHHRHDRHDDYRHGGSGHRGNHHGHGDRDRGGLARMDQRREHGQGHRGDAGIARDPDRRFVSNRVVRQNGGRIDRVDPATRSLQGDPSYRAPARDRTTGRGEIRRSDRSSSPARTFTGIPRDFRRMDSGSRSSYLPYREAASDTSARPRERIRSDSVRSRDARSIRGAGRHEETVMRRVTSQRETTLSGRNQYRQVRGGFSGTNFSRPSSPAGRSGHGIGRGSWTGNQGSGSRLPGRVGGPSRTCGRRC